MLALTLLGAASIGVLLLPLTLGLFWLAWRFAGPGLQQLGIAMGLGIVSLWFAIAGNGTGRSCLSGTSETSSAPGQRTHEFSCGGLPHRPFLFAGIVLLVAAAIGGWRLRGQAATADRG